MTIPRFWREIDQRYNLKGMKCGNCQGVFMPARSLCPRCRHASVGKLSPHQFSGEGVVELATVVRNPPQGFDLQAPYVMAMVRLDEGPRLTAQVVDAAPERVVPGARVTRTFRKINEEGESGVVHYGYKFVLR